MKSSLNPLFLPGGPRNILPGILVFSTLGSGASYVSQKLKRPEGQEGKPKTSWLDSKWSPLTRLSDADYVERLEEKLLRIDADLAIIDDHIASLKAKENANPPSASSDAPNKST